MRRPPLVVLFLLLFAGMLLFIFWQLLREPTAPAQNTNIALPERRSAPEVTVADPARGNTMTSAPTIVVFGDYQCEICKQQEEELNQVLKSRDDVRIVWKNAPFVQKHPQAQAAAEAALCAGRQGQYFTYHDTLFNQTALDDQIFSAIAIGLGLDENAFRICTETHATAPLVRRTTEEAVALELTGVPTIFIGERRFDGLITAAQMLTALPAP